MCRVAIERSRENCCNENAGSMQGLISECRNRAKFTSEAPDGCLMHAIIV